MSKSYRCFVCGATLDDFIKYKSHIIDTHEEGREYIICPLARCQAPVRDVRSHFKVYHKTEKLPKNCQLKALIWKDIRDVRKKSKKPIFKDGNFISIKNHGKPMHYRSGYEHDVYKCLEIMNEVVSYDVEPFSVSYLFGGRVRQYWPDLVVAFRDGTVRVWEIKPANQRELPMNKAKWVACHEYCKARSWTFEVIDEQGIKNLKEST